MIVLTAIHGNEPAGLRAAERVLDRLESLGPEEIRGRLVVLAGNLVHLSVFWAATSFALHRLLLFYPERRGARVAARKKFHRDVLQIPVVEPEQE